jgi:hypothetical protein
MTKNVITFPAPVENKSFVNTSLCTVRCRQCCWHFGGICCIPCVNAKQNQRQTCVVRWFGAFMGVGCCFMVIFIIVYILHLDLLHIANAMFSFTVMMPWMTWWHYSVCCIVSCRSIIEPLLLVKCWSFPSIFYNTL